MTMFNTQEIKEKKWSNQSIIGGAYKHCAKGGGGVNRIIMLGRLFLHVSCKSNFFPPHQVDQKIFLIHTSHKGKICFSLIFFLQKIKLHIQ